MVEEEMVFPFDAVDAVESNIQKRISCCRCRRPERVCICSSFPPKPVGIETTVHILQHPREQDSRLLTTVPLLRECIPKEKCIIYRGRRFPSSKYQELHEMLATNKNIVLLFPSSDALTIEEYKKQKFDGAVDLFVLDGTWREAKSIYHNCKFLHNLTKVKLSGDWRSEYVIRTQPSDNTVSTLEAVAISIAELEEKQKLIEIARKPLKALCDFQLDHGAQVHQSKEELARIGIKYRCFEKVDLVRK